jgi:hypothetical protein
MQYLNSLLDNDKFDDINVLVSKMNNIYLNAASKTLIYKRPRRPNNKIPTQIQKLNLMTQFVSFSSSLKTAKIVKSNIINFVNESGEKLMF